MRKWTLTPFSASFSSEGMVRHTFRLPVIASMLAAICVTLGGCPVAQLSPNTGHPNKRLHYYLTKYVDTAPRGKEFESFIKSELGEYFSVDDYMAYMEENDASCKIDIGIAVCKYVEFRSMSGPGIDKKYNKQFHTFCFWSIHVPGEIPRLYDRQVAMNLLDEWPSVDRKAFSMSVGVPDCPPLSGSGEMR